jgi:alkylhydroperoxidase/carboxymuconolactone decarboxylase family protein YurZ
LGPSTGSRADDKHLLGLRDDEIKEVLLQSAIYCGVPAANAAFAVAQRVLEEDS